MTELNQVSIDKARRLAKLIDNGAIATATEIVALEAKIDSVASALPALENKVSEALTTAQETQKMEGAAGHTPIAGVDFPIPKDGANYVLTEQDMMKIATMIPPPDAVLHVGETEVIREQPVVTEVTKIVENPITPPEIVVKLESLKDEDRLDISAIKGVDAKETALGDSILNRAIGIVDQRTSFLINKVSNLAARPTGGANPSGIDTSIQTKSGNSLYGDSGLLYDPVGGGSPSVTITAFNPKYVLHDLGNDAIAIMRATGGEFDIINSDANNPSIFAGFHVQYGGGNIEYTNTATSGTVGGHVWDITTSIAHTLLYLDPATYGVNVPNVLRVGTGCVGDPSTIGDFGDGSILQVTGASSFHGNGAFGTPMFTPAGQLPALTMWSDIANSNNNAFGVLSNNNSSSGGVIIKPSMITQYASTAEDIGEIQGTNSNLSAIANLCIQGEGGNLYIGAMKDDGSTLPIQLTGAVSLSSTVQRYKGKATTGYGVPAIYGYTRAATGRTAAVASVATYTVGAADGTFLVSANILVTTATLHNFSATVTYTDEGSTSRTVTLQFSTLAGAFVTAMTNAQGTVPYEGVPLHIRAKASTAITIATTGAFTTVVYNVEGSITQIA